MANWRIQKLEREKTEVLMDSEDIIETAEKESRELTATESDRLQKNRAKLEILAGKLKKEIDAASYATLENALPIDNMWPGQSALETRFDSGNGRRPVAQGAVRKTFKELFPPTGAQSTVSFNELCGAINTGTFLPGMTAMNEGSGSAGGFLVPDQVSYDTLGAIYESSIVLPRCRTYPMSSEVLKVAGLDASSAESGTLFGGMTFQWVPEEGTLTPTDPTLRKVELTARKLAILSKVSNELNEDSPIGAQIESAMRSGGAWAVDYALLRGTGAGQPRGVLADPALITVSAEDAQDADSIVFENLTKMLARIHPACFNNSVWVVNPTTIPQLLQLSMPIGLGGVAIPVLRENNGGWQILTRPVLMSEKLPVLGDAGDILLCDLSQYGVGLRKDLTIERSGHIYFTSDESCWRGILRLDGQGLWKSAYTPRHGDSLSWCVQLAART